MVPLVQALDNFLIGCRAPAVLGVCSFTNVLSISREFGLRTREAAVVEFRSRMLELLRPDDGCFSISDDYFCFVLTNLINANHAQLAANKLEAIFDRPLRIEQEDLQLSVHAGLSYFESCEDEETASNLYRQAEEARSRAVEKTKPVEIYIDDQLQLGGLIHLATDFATALTKRELCLDYQPKYRLSDGEMIGAEALVRWRREGTVIPPGEFLPKLNARQLWDMTLYCLRRLLRELQGLNSNLPVALNLDPSVVARMDFPDFVENELRLWGIEPRRLAFEITETAAIDNYEASGDVLNRLRTAGHTIAIDDYGTGQSSLEHFRKLPADEIKIDRQFVSNVATDLEDQRIIKSVLDLAHETGRYVVAEGIEDSAALEYLIDQGCDAGQGYYLAMPMSRTQFALLFSEEPASDASGKRAL